MKPHFANFTLVQGNVLLKLKAMKVAKGSIAKPKQSTQSALSVSQKLGATACLLRHPKNLAHVMLKVTGHGAKATTTNPWSGARRVSNQPAAARFQKLKHLSHP